MGIKNENYIKNCTHSKKDEFDLCSVMTNMAVKGAKHLGTYLTYKEEESLIEIVDLMGKLNETILELIIKFKEFKEGDGERRCDTLEKICTLTLKHPAMRWGVNHERITMTAYFKLIAKFAAGKDLTGKELGSVLEDISEFVEWSQNIMLTGIQ